jgi:predicted RNA-binding protein YlxR (DUF448 family)
MRTCTGCRLVAPQHELVRLAFDGPRLVIDPYGHTRRLPGRGAYVHAKTACVTVAGLSRSLRRQVSPADVSRILLGMSQADDNWVDQPRKKASQNGPGLEGGDTVEMPTRIKAKDDRSEDARL